MSDRSENFLLGFFAAVLVVAVSVVNWADAQVAPPAPSPAASSSQPVTIPGGTNINNFPANQIVSPQPYPSGAVPVNVTASGTTGTTVATLPAAVGKTTYICGWHDDVMATSIAVTNLQITGLSSGGSLNFLVTVLAQSTQGVGSAQQFYAPCLPASALNTAIVVTGGVPGTGGVQQVNAWGYQL